MSSSFYSIDPRTGARIATYDATDKDSLEDKLNRVYRSAKEWRGTELDLRAAGLRQLGILLEQDRERLALLASSEMGKHLEEARSEVDKCSQLCRVLPDQAARALAPKPVALDDAHARIRAVPLGVILGLMPWNFPYWQVARFALPALAAGNVCLLKHAANVQGCAEAFCELVQQAFGRNDLLVNLRLDNEAAEALIADKRVAGVSLTGSTGAGKAVGAAAGEAIKPAVLELGGNDPYVVLADADLELALEACVAGRLLNAGQSCISAKRLIVVEALAERFAERLMSELQAWTFLTSDRTQDAEQQLAPMAREDLREDLHQQVQNSIAKGAKCSLGGKLPTADGYWYPVTLLTDVAPGMPAFDEELFGPVVSVIPARDKAHAIQLANQSSFGLGAAIFTRDVVEGERIARDEIHAGSCFVNTFVRSHVDLPFGGIRQSGYGRELTEAGIQAFCNLKTTYVHLGV